jgi:hypothetical protein
MKRALLGCWILALATVSARAEQRDFEIRLTEPAPGTSVIAGSTASIAWEASNVPAGVEEWEAFVSVDGGRTYPMRITPHLEAGIRRFTWTVPSLPGAELSILLRFGDERDEHPFSFPARTRVTGSLPLTTLSSSLIPESPSFANGEEDDHGERLVAWVEGSRAGSDLKQVVAFDVTLDSGHEWNQDRVSHLTAAIGSTSKRFHPAAFVLLTDVYVTPRGRNRQRVFWSPRADILTLSGRLNI